MYECMLLGKACMVLQVLQYSVRIALFTYTFSHKLAQSPGCRLASDVATTWHLCSPFLDISMPVLILLLRPETLFLTVMLDISPLAALGKNSFNVIYAVSFCLTGSCGSICKSESCSAI